MYKKHFNIKFIIFLGILIFLLFFGYSIYGSIKEFISEMGKTSPEEVMNYTNGEFIIKPRPFMSFQEYYTLLKPQEEKSFYSESYSNYTLIVPKLEFVMPKIEFDYKSYDYEGEYYDLCAGKKIEINFTNPKYSEFQFNYKDITFNYKLNLYPDLYYFSDNLKNQDCYFDTDKYTEGFLEDPYNNRFLDAISKDFMSLKEKGYSSDEIVEIATLFVQSIPYGTDSSELNRYPYETLYEDEGNCLDKSLILVGILKNLGYKSYIITGKSDYEYHALAGIVCDKGNVKYQNEDICFIETTIFTPIDSEIEITIDDYIPVSNGTLIYTGANYGRGLINTIESKTSEIESIESQLESLESELRELNRKMCETDCTYCNANLIDPMYCDDAYEYNRYVEDYNKLVKEYNVLVEKWYTPYYDLENLMFGNVELIERK